MLIRRHELLRWSERCHYRGIPLSVGIPRKIRRLVAPPRACFKVKIEACKLFAKFVHSPFGTLIHTFITNLTIYYKCWLFTTNVVCQLVHFTTTSQNPGEPQSIEAMFNCQYRGNVQLSVSRQCSIVSIEAMFNCQYRGNVQLSVSRQCSIVSIEAMFNCQYRGNVQLSVSRQCSIVSIEAMFNCQYRGNVQLSVSRQCSIVSIEAMFNCQYRGNVQLSVSRQCSIVSIEAMFNCQYRGNVQLSVSRQWFCSLLPPGSRLHFGNCIKLIRVLYLSLSLFKVLVREFEYEYLCNCSHCPINVSNSVRLSVEQWGSIWLLQWPDDSGQS